MSFYLLQEDGGKILLENNTGALLLEFTVLPFYLPYEWTSVLIVTSNTDPFGIDAEQTVIIE